MLQSFINAFFLPQFPQLIQLRVEWRMLSDTQQKKKYITQNLIKQQIQCALLVCNPSTGSLH